MKTVFKGCGPRDMVGQGRCINVKSLKTLLDVEDIGYIAIVSILR